MHKNSSILRSLFLVGVVGAAIGSQAAVVNLSGGGTDKIRQAIEATSNTASTIVITDSATYLETATCFFGPRNGVGHACSIEASPGQNPTIKEDVGGVFVMYSGCPEDVHIGSQSGGRITFDGTGTFQQVIWYIGQSNGRVGAASKLTCEKVDFNFTGNLNADQITFGAGGNDATHTTTNAGMTFNDCTFKGGHSAITSLYGGAGNATTNTININRCIFIDNVEAGTTPIELGKYGINPITSEVRLTSSVIYLSGAENTPASERNCIVGRQGFTIIDHSDLINDGTTATVARACTGVGATANIQISNSILHSLGAGTAMFSGGVGIAKDSNVSGSPQNSGFTYTNVISEYPVYGYVGTNIADPNFFKVHIAKLSATHGPSPPLGSRGTTGTPPSAVKDWSLYN